MAEFYIILENTEKCIVTKADHSCLEMGRGWHGWIIKWYEILKADKNVAKFYKCICMLKLTNLHFKYLQFIVCQLYLSSVKK